MLIVLIAVLIVLITNGANRANYGANRAIGQDVGHVRLSSRAETVYWAGARPGTECLTARRPVKSDTHRPAARGVSWSRGHAGECHAERGEGFTNTP